MNSNLFLYDNTSTLKVKTVLKHSNVQSKWNCTPLEMLYFEREIKVDSGNANNDRKQKIIQYNEYKL